MCRPRVEIGLLVFFLAGEVGCGDPRGAAMPPPRRPRVRVTTVQTATITEWVMGEGVADAVARELLFFEQAGRVTFVATDHHGDPIREGSSVRGPQDGARFGQLLAQLDKRGNALEVSQAEAAMGSVRGELAAAEAAIRGLKDTLEKQNRDLARARALYAADGMALSDYESQQTAVRRTKSELRAARSRLDAIRSELSRLAAQRDAASLGLEKTALFAPFDGRISRMNIRAGDLVTAPVQREVSEAAREASAAMVVVDDSAFFVLIHLPPELALTVKEDQPAFVSYAAHPLIEAEKVAFKDGHFARGRVWSVSPAITRDRRSVIVRLRVEDPKRLLRDGAYVTAWIGARRAVGVPVVTYETMLGRTGAVAAFVFDPDSQTVNRRRIKLGLLGLGRAEVKAGLRPGEMVVVDGHHALADGDRVEPIDQVGSEP